MARPIRFTFIILLAALGTAGAAISGWRFARVSAPVNGPIILISIDTLRADHLPAYGYQKVKTPAIDTLAADGIVFERAYSHSPQTLPAHAALLSGRLPFETGIRDDDGVPVKPLDRWMPQMLRDRGFATAGVVSAAVLRKASGIGQGFEFFDDEMAGPLPESPFEAPRRDGADSEAIAERWLDQQRSPRVFLFLHLNEPHKPYAPPAAYAEYLPYDSAIAYADEIVGRLMRYLKAHDLYDRSTIILLSDHGEGLGDHGEQTHGVFLYDEAIHVPLIVKPAGGAGAGRRVTDVVQHIDLAPTILDLAKAPIPGNLRGRSLGPVLEGARSLGAHAVYSEAMYAHQHFGWGELRALTGPEYRYIKAPREELYNLVRDPHERDNVAAGQPAALQGHRSAIVKLTAATNGDEVLVDPKDKQGVIETYRAANELAAARKWRDAIRLLQGIVRDDPEQPEVWLQLAALANHIGRHDLVADAYQHVAALRAEDPSPLLGAAAALVKMRKLDDARGLARQATEVASEHDLRARASAHQLLAQIALARHDTDLARQEAALAHGIDKNLALPAYIEGRILYEQGRYDEALPSFEEAVGAADNEVDPPIAELNFYAADTLIKLDRLDEAEAAFERELRSYPYDSRARAGLAALLHKMKRTDEAEQALDDMIRIAPTPESYTLASRLWTTFGNRRRASAVRAEARETLVDVPKSSRR